MGSNHANWAGHDPMRFEAVAIGCSAGGFDALKLVLGGLTGAFPLPVLVAQHMHPSDEGRFATHLNQELDLPVSEPVDKQPVRGGEVLIAPANYHMLIEADRTVVLNVDPRVHGSRPSVDVLLESAARVWEAGLMCILLTGANADGADAARLARELGGLVVAQDPQTAVAPQMPLAAIERGGAQLVLTAEEIGGLLTSLESELRAA